MIATSGWIIWRSDSFAALKTIKKLYVSQLILNWLWTPLFFSYHLTGVSLICLCSIIILVALLIMKSYKKINSASLLLIPYLLWLLFAVHLNFYIWQNN
jgi:benzodiazapine receptor